MAPISIQQHEDANKITISLSKWLLPIVLGGISFFGGVLVTSVRAQDKVTQNTADVEEIKKSMRDDYVTKPEFQAVVKGMEGKLDLILSLVKHK
jgi:hypothetical protein